MHNTFIDDIPSRKRPRSVKFSNEDFTTMNKKQSSSKHIVCRAQASAQDIMLKKKAAVKTIIRFLRCTKNSLKRLAASIQQTQLVQIWPSEVSFQEMVSRSQKKWVIRDLRRFITNTIFLIQRAVVKQGLQLDDDETVDKFNVRIFIASFLVINRPENCFESIGHLERQVQESAAQL
eukprot:152911-Hanusia_phi.AAC.1